MRRITTLLAITALVAVLLTACTTASEQPGGAGPSVTEPIPGVQEPLPGAIEPMATQSEEGMGYPVPAETAVGEAPTVETPASETEPAEPPVETVEVIPPTGPMDPGRVSNLLGSLVLSQDSEEIGQVDDFMVDISTGAVTYVVVAVSNEEGSEQLLVPIPIAFMKWDSTTGAFMLATDRQTVLGAPYFEGGEYPDTQAAGWDAEFLSYWETISPGN